MDFIDKNDKMIGFEDINIETMAVPFIRIAQDLSPQLKKNRPEYIEGLEVGDIFNSVSGKVYGKEIEFTPVKFEHIFTEWKPDRGGFVGYHSVQRAYEIATVTTFNKMKTEDGNDLEEAYMYYVVVKGHEKDGVAIISASSSMIKQAKKLNAMMNMQYFTNGEKALPYHQVYKAKSVLAQSDKHEWYTLEFVFSSFVDEPMYLAAKEQRTLIAEGRTTVDYAALEDKTEKTAPSAPY